MRKQADFVPSTGQDEVSAVLDRPSDARALGIEALYQTLALADNLGIAACPGDS